MSDNDSAVARSLFVPGKKKFPENFWDFRKSQGSRWNFVWSFSIPRGKLFGENSTTVEHELCNFVVSLWPFILVILAAAPASTLNVAQPAGRWKPPTRDTFLRKPTTGRLNLRKKFFINDSGREREVINDVAALPFHFTFLWEICNLFMQITDKNRGKLSRRKPQFQFNPFKGGEAKRSRCVFQVRWLCYLPPSSQ